MKNIISYKIVTLFLIFGIAFGLIFFSYVKDEIKEDELTYIKSELMEQTLKSTAIFLRYHDRVFSSSDYYIDRSLYCRTQSKSS